MSSKLSGWDDTIVALATAPGISAIGVVRLSGKEAIGIASALFPAKDLSRQSSHTLHVGYLSEDGKDIDEVVISLFKAPKSYTGEDIVEISCHGSPYVQQQVIQACIRKGARLAKPGEFTQRAFLNAKLDLTQAEAVGDIIASNTAASQKAAMHNMRGGFSKDLKILREKLIEFSALIELELDFSQEDVEFADRKKFYQLIEEALQLTTSLYDSFAIGNVIKTGVSVAIIGKPNAGKSTLLNALLNEERAIVSDIAGTTRDTIEEVININGILFRLIDTAGIREHTADVIEGIGVRKSLEKMKSADVVLYMFDAAAERPEDVTIQKQVLEQDKINFLLLANKTDILDPGTKAAWERMDVIMIEAMNNTGINTLRERLFERTVGQQLQAETTIITNARHHEVLEKLISSLSDVKKGLDDHLPGDLLSPDIRRSLHYISELTGDISNENVLDFIFSRFCIGK